MFKKITLSCLVLPLIIGTANAKDAVSLKTDADKASYGVGLNIGSSIKSQGLPDLNLEAIILGMKDAIEDKEIRLSKEELTDAFTNMQKKEAEEKARVSNENLKKGEAFLAKNAKEKGVQVTKSGLQYKVIKAGKGAKPTAEDVVVTNYRGTLINGTEFDSSYKRNEPVSFPVNRVIPGWTEALQLMPVGSTWKLYVPAKLAYGEFSPTAAIPPNSTLVFEVELLKIEDKEKAVN